MWVSVVFGPTQVQVVAGVVVAMADVHEYRSSSWVDAGRTVMNGFADDKTTAS